MKCFILFCICLVTVLTQPISDDESLNQSQADMKFFLYEDENGIVKVEHLVDVPINLTASASDVAYYYYCRSDPENGVEIHSNNVSALQKTAYNIKRDTIFIIHGWKNSKESDVNSHIREYILRDHDVNIFVVDWSPVAGKNYYSAQKRVKLVGEYIADFTKDLSSKFGLNLRKLKFVGHSLGAHIAGNAGAALNGQVDRIVGLDPAGPLFSDSNKDNRIDESDAHFVQIIHTNDGKLGYKGRLGHADYYPNGGKSQPGCGVDLTGSCSHSRAYAYYAESLTSDRFLAKQCDSYSDFTNGLCRNRKSSMGMFNVDTTASGTYFLDTNQKTPWAKESVGIEPDENALGFYFFSADYPSEGTLINISDYTSISQTSFSPEKNTYFIIHGWRDSVTSSSVTSIKNALLNKHDINVFLVNWDEIANELYPIAVYKLEKLGIAFGSLINNLVSVGGLDLDRTTFVGHSLGAHLAGIAGMALDGQLDVIVGLDPAGIGYNKMDSSLPKLNPSSAKFVHVIHTAGRGLGSMNQMGHADYYPNGGGSQPMCGVLDLNCSHLKVLKYYVESLEGGNFIAKMCQDYLSYTNGDCDNEESSKMGSYHVDKTANGTYYLQTNLEPPYAKN